MCWQLRHFVWRTCDSHISKGFEQARSIEFHVSGLDVQLVRALR
jgi:hypothetical protein